MLSRLAPHSSGERVQCSSTENLLERISTISPRHHLENGKTFAEAAPNPPRHRKRRSRLRHSMMMQGYNLEDVTPAWTKCKFASRSESSPHRALQFPQWFLLVPSVCHRVWKYFHPKPPSALPCMHRASAFGKKRLPKEW